jgi:putative NADPH-quinone reductase
MERALLVVAALDDGHRELAATAAETLAGRHRVDVIDLHGVGFVPAMSRSERRAYHSDRPLLDAHATAHAALVVEASLLAFVFPTDWWSPPPILKAWLERVIVPGVGFVFDDRGRVRPALARVGTIVGITSYALTSDRLARGGDGGRHIITHALRLNAPKARTVWISARRSEVATLHPEIRRCLG